jgi:formylglycine-generating enzyme required for sulfatase activity
MMLAVASPQGFGPSGVAVAYGREPIKDAQTARATVLWKTFADKVLKKGADNPGTWVDVERWSVAHAMLETNTQLENANEYFSKVAWVSLNRGLVSDTDIQVTDLLRTYLRFSKSDRLSAESKAHLLKMFKEWKVPNPDRNRDADVRYEWPYFYTENHSLNILVASHLIDAAVFPNAPVRANKGTPALKQFLTDRLRYGWSEFHSPQYGLVTAKALSLLTDFSPDPVIKSKAAALLDVLALEYAQQAIHPYRGVAFLRGSAMRFDNSNNSFVDLARLWFGDPTSPTPPTKAAPFLVHLMDSDYRPPALAGRMIQTRQQSGAYTVRQTMVTGRAKLRVPLVTRVTSTSTLSSAQGTGHYYDGGYWMFSSSAGPENVISGSYGASNSDRNIFQYHNVMMVFGKLEARGGFKPTTQENITIYSDGTSRLGVVELPQQANLVVMDESPGRPIEAFAAEIIARQPAFDPETGRFTFIAPDKSRIEVLNRRDRDVYRLERVLLNSDPYQVDNNMLIDSNEMRSELGSGWYQARCFGQTWQYTLKETPQPVSWNWARPLADRVSNTMGISFNYVPAGEFPMGSPVTEGRSDEQPVRWVHVPAYYIGTYEITYGLWKLFVKANPGKGVLPEWYEREGAKSDAYPITYISREDAMAFCEWLGTVDGNKYRLPTEAEWEKAARGWSYRVYPWGDTYDRSQSGNPNMIYAPIGNRPQDLSPFGCYDMAGNVWEWTADNYSFYEKDGVIVGAPLPGFVRKPEKSFDPVVRGCGWNYDPETFRCSYRSSMPQGSRSLHIGFRVVMEVNVTDNK